MIASVPMSKGALLAGVDMPQTVVANAAKLASEVDRLATDIDACKDKLPAQFYASWQVWHDATLDLAEQVQKPAWYEYLLGGQWTLARQAFSDEGLREQMQMLVKWRNDARAKGCTMSGPDPQVPPMALTDKLLWGAGIIAGVALVGFITYGFVTRQGPVQIINRIARR
jgi:hypothetical protein